MFIQKGISKDYAENYLKRRIEGYRNVKSYIEDLEYKKKLFNKIGFSINGKSILDLSSGPGVDTKMFFELGANKVICHDKFEEYLNIVKEINKENISNIEIHKGEIDDVDYIPDNSIDLIWCNVSFYYSKNDILLLGKIINKIKKGGLIYVSTCGLNKYKKYSNLIKILTYPLHFLYLTTNYKIITLAYNNIQKMINKAQKEKLALLMHKKHSGESDINTLIWKK